MGWIFGKKPSGSVSDFLARECLTWSRAPEAAKPVVVATYSKGGAYFYAVQFPQAFYDFYETKPPKCYQPALDGSVTGAVVILTERSGGELGWKDMDETSGPYADGVPASFLAKLSPLTDDPSAQYAKAWRARQGALKVAA